MRRPRRLARDATGTNLVEAALITPLLLFLTFSIIELAMALFVYHALESGVTQATRAGVTGNGGGARESTLIQALRVATPTLTIPDSAVTFSHMSPGGSGWISGVGGPDDIEKMSVNYTWRLVTPVFQPLFPAGEVHIRVESARKNESKFE